MDSFKRLEKYQVEIIIKVALLYLEKPYTENFGCVDFIRLVYREANIEIPLIHGHSIINDFRIQKEDIDNLPIGYLIFLKRKDTLRKERRWTHVAIVLSKDTCIHCSKHFGGKVVISQISKVFEKYDFVE